METSLPSLRWWTRGLPRPLDEAVLLALAAILFIVATVLSPQTALGVQRSVAQQGQALILPIYSTRSGFDTLVSVTNTARLDGAPVALKVNFVGRELEVESSLNVYLGPLGTWAFGLANEGETSASGPFTAGCALEATSNDGFRPIEELSLESTLGYVEVVEMGSVIDELLVQAIEQRDCEALAQYWQSVADPDDQLAAPPGRTRAGLSLINVARGTMYSVDAVALSDFRDTPMHTPPGDPVPDLLSATETDGFFESVNCNPGACVTDRWDDPLAALSAALMATTIHGEYSVNEAIGARTEIMLLAPVARYELQQLALRPPSGAFVLFTDRKGGRQSLPPPGTPTPIYGGNRFEASFYDPVEIDTALEFVSIFSAAAQGETILGTGLERMLGSTSIGGNFQLGLTLLNVSDPAPTMTSIDGRDYFGLPILAVSLQEVINASLPAEADRQRVASYGSTFVPSHRLEVEPAASTP